MTNQTGSTSVLLTGLENNTTYYFKAQLSNSVNDVSGNNIYSFTPWLTRFRQLYNSFGPVMSLIPT